MLISHKKKFIFLKTYKTGSSSIESVLRKYCGETPFDFDSKEDIIYDGKSLLSEEGIITYPRFRKRSLEHCNNGKDYYWDHMSAAELKEKIGEDIWNSYYKFCVVRNPFDKVISLLNFFYYRNGKTPEYFIGSNIGTEEIAELISLSYKNKLNPIEDKYFDSNIYTIQGNICVDRIVRYEKYEEELKEIFSYLNISIDWEDFPNINSDMTNKQISKKHILNDEMIEYIKDRSMFEINNFGYTFKVGS